MFRNFTSPIFQTHHWQVGTSFSKLAVGRHDGVHFVKSVDRLAGTTFVHVGINLPRCEPACFLQSSFAFFPWCSSTKKSMQLYEPPSISVRTDSATWFDRKPTFIYIPMVTPLRLPMPGENRKQASSVAGSIIPFSFYCFLHFPLPYFLRFLTCVHVYLLSSLASFSLAYFPFCTDFVLCLSRPLLCYFLQARSSIAI